MHLPLLAFAKIPRLTEAIPGRMLADEVSLQIARKVRSRLSPKLMRSAMADQRYVATISLTMITRYGEMTMMMRVMLVTAGLLAALFAVSVQAAENSSTEEENMFLSLVLKRSSADGGYTVVTPEASLEGHINSPQDKQWLKTSLTAHGKADPAVVTQLIDKLLERNKKPVRLSLKLAPKNGYLVDYEGIYAKYFEKDGGGWEAWHKEHPQAHGSTTVSLPAYEQKNGLVLVYKGQQFDYLAGAGLIILYKFDNGRLKELDNIMLWIS